MNIRILLASRDERYAMRLSDALSQSPMETGDTIETSLFTDSVKLKNYMAANEKTPKYDVAIVDDSMLSAVSKAAPVTLLITEDISLDDLMNEVNTAQYLFKFKRVTSIIRKMLLTLAKSRKDKGIGDSAVCAFYSPRGGVGTSSIAVAFAKASVAMGIKPLFVSLEHFNSTELFFGEEGDKGLYDVFYVLAGKGGVTTAIDAAKNKIDDVAVLNKFPAWLEVAQLTPESIEIFINAARAAHEIDVVILDLGNGFANFTEKVLRCADEIFIISGADEVSELKLNMLTDNETSFMHDFLSKSNLVYNKAVSTDAGKDYGCKTVTYIPPKTGASVASVAGAVETHLRGLVNPLWSKKITS
ncbi:MAG: hypothetical protein FWC70_07300 [Defluviitaleaceae bacterium]|nr:hypothetical protein [Defluviitaleaceae bacterium]